MRVTLLFFGIVNLVLLGFLVTTNSRPGVPLTPTDSNDKVTAILTKLGQIADTAEKQAGVVRAMQQEIATARQDLIDLRTALTALDDKSQKSAEAFRATATRFVEQIDKKQAQPQTNDKQITELAAELKRLNEQFKRVVDFAAGRSGL